MITLPNVTTQNAVEKIGISESPVSDGENVVEDFLQLVRTAKAGLMIPDTDEPVSRKVAVKTPPHDLAAELTDGKVTVESQDSLASLLMPQGKTFPAIKAMPTAGDKTPLDNEKERDPDLQAISALFAMLPHPEQAISPTPVADAKAAVAQKSMEFAIGTNAPATARQTPEINHLPVARSEARGENSVERFIQPDHSVSPRAVENQQILTPSVSSSAPVLSTGAPLPTPATPILNSQLGSQEWQQQLSQQVVLFTRQGQQQAELRLHPEHLGKVEISLKLDDNQLQLQILSPHSHVRAAIEAALPVLRSSLNESGVQLSQSHVGGEGSMPQQQTDQREQHAGKQNGTFSFDSPEDDMATLAVSESLQRMAQNQGAVDTFA